MNLDSPMSPKFTHTILVLQNSSPVIYQGASLLHCASSEIEICAVFKELFFVMELHAWNISTGTNIIALSKFFSISQC